MAAETPALLVRDRTPSQPTMSASGSLETGGEWQQWGASPTKHNRLPAKSLAQISVASDNDKASSTSTPR
jgi:hypothetical protein